MCTAISSATLTTETGNERLERGFRGPPLLSSRENAIIFPEFTRIFLSRPCKLGEGAKRGAWGGGARKEEGFPAVVPSFSPRVHGGKKTAVP